MRGVKNKNDEVLVSLLECKIRLYIALRFPSAKASNVKEILEHWLQFVSDILALCKTITADNRREFENVSILENEDYLFSLLIFIF